MTGYAPTVDRSIPLLTGVRSRILISLLAALLALSDHGWAPNAAPNGTRGNFSTVAGVEGTRVSLACRGRGPSTVVLVASTAAVTLVIDDAVQAQLARSVRFCTISILEAATRSALDLTRGIPALLYSVGVPAPYVIVTHTTAPMAYHPPSGPFDHLVSGYVLITSSGPSQPGIVKSVDGRTWPLPEDERNDIVLAILALFWPPDDG